jgi:hypothetical protein
VIDAEAADGIGSILMVDVGREVLLGVLLLILSFSAIREAKAALLAAIAQTLAIGVGAFAGIFVFEPQLLLLYRYFEWLPMSYIASVGLLAIAWTLLRRKVSNVSSKASGGRGGSDFSA